MASSTQPLVPIHHGHRFFRAKSLSCRSLHGAIFVPCDTLNCCVFAGGCAPPEGNQTAGRSRTREHAANRKNTSCLLITRRADRAARPAGEANAPTAEIAPRHPAARMQNRRRKKHSSKKSSGFLVRNPKPPRKSRRQRSPNPPPETGRGRRAASARPGCASRRSWK